MPSRRRTKKPSAWTGFRTVALILTMICTIALLSQPALANTFVITDGNQVKTHITFATDPATVLDEAGFRLDENDTYTTAHDNGVFEITVRRNQTVTVEYEGQKIQVESLGETVAQLLERLNITVNGDTRLSADSGTYTFDGMVLKVDQVVRVTEKYIAVLPYEVTYYEDPSLPAGVEAVVTEGKSGQMSCEAMVVYEGGRETSRTVLSQTVLERPVNAVVAVGTGAQQDVQAQCGLIIGDNIIITEDGQVLTYTGTMQVRATAYTHTDEGCDFTTATMTTVHVGTVAVDPTVIPYGTRMFIVTNDGEVVYGISTAEDCGGDIKNDRVDLYYPTEDECWEFGRRNATIYFLG